jgi:hypothetical protein
VIRLLVGVCAVVPLSSQKTEQARALGGPGRSAQAGEAARPRPSPQTVGGAGACGLAVMGAPAPTWSWPRGAARHQRARRCSLCCLVQSRRREALPRPWRAVPARVRAEQAGAGARCWVPGLTGARVPRAGISRDSLHKRRLTGGKQKKWRKKRKCAPALPRAHPPPGAAPVLARPAACWCTHICSINNRRAERRAARPPGSSWAGSRPTPSCRPT